MMTARVRGTPEAEAEIAVTDCFSILL